MRIDHVILAAADLDAATARVERLLGVPAAGGGRHDGLGTHNRVIPVGNGFVEVLAIADPGEAASSELGRAVAGRLRATGDGLVGWAVAVEDVDAVAARLGLAVTSIGRQGMTARLTGVAEAMADGFLPFYIQRDAGIADPGGGRGAQAGGLSWVEVAGDAQRLRTWIGEDAAALPVRVVDGAPGLRAVGIGEHVLR
jgi:catechol 2,3-dioxygenase-like lactoylglutathione lyase family enzyme